MENKFIAGFTLKTYATLLIYAQCLPHRYPEVLTCLFHWSDDIWKWNYLLHWKLKKKWSIFIFFIVNWVINKGWSKKQYSRIWGVDIMNSYSSFNTSKGKSGRFVHFVFKNSNTAMLNLRKKVFQKLEGQIFWMLFCIETQNTIYNNEK